MASAVRIAAAGEALVSPAQLARLLPQLSRTKKPTGADLTDRERDVLTLFSRVATKAMAAELFLSVNTIRNYTQSVFVKLGAHSKLEAVSIAVREGIISYPHLDEATTRASQPPAREQMHPRPFSRLETQCPPRSRSPGANASSVT